MSCVSAAAPTFMNEFTVAMIAAATPENTSPATSAGVKCSRKIGVAWSAFGQRRQLARHHERLHRDADAEVQQLVEQQRDGHQQRIPLELPRIAQHVELVITCGWPSEPIANTKKNESAASGPSLPQGPRNSGRRP